MVIVDNDRLMGNGKLAICQVLELLSKQRK